MERLEDRQLLSGIIHIDAHTVQQAAGTPLLLDQANTTYILDTNIDAAGTAIVIGAANVTLDLNGHTVAYGDSRPLVVTNGGFEQGGPGGTVPGWDLSGAPGATRVPAMTGMYGQWMLQLNNITGTQTILSDPVAIPTANHEYEAAITPKGPYGITVNITVVDAVTGAVLATGTSRGPDRGFAAVVTFTPKTTDAVRLRVDVSPASGQPATIDLDYAAVAPSRDFGILATQTWSAYLPAQLQTPAILASYRTAANVTVENGSVLQGQGQAAQGSPLYFESLPGFTVQNVSTYADGMDTSNLDGTWASNGAVFNSTFSAAIDRISDRMDLVAAINLDNFDGIATLSGNRIGNVPQLGILVAGMPTEQRVTIAHNEIRQQSIVTDGYGIELAGVQNFEVGFNTIIPVNGRGILVDGWGRMPTANGQIHDNYVEAQEAPNLEYGDRMEVTALRLRNWGSTQKNLTITRNTFLARTGPGAVYDAQGARISAWNDSGQMTNSDNLIQNNVFKAIALTTDPYYLARALSISEVGVGTGLQITNNLLESNDVALNLGDNDSWNAADQDITMTGNSIRVSADGPARPFKSVYAGDYQTTVSDIRLGNTYLENGAPAAIVNAWNNVYKIQVTWIHGAPPAGDPLGGAGNTQGTGTSGGNEGTGTTGTDTGSAAGTTGGGNQWVFGIGLDGQVWAQTYTAAGQWGGWSLTHVGVVKAIGSVNDAAGNPLILAIGLDNQVWMQMRLGSQWSGWGPTCGGSVKAISATRDANGNAEVFAIGLDNQVWAETMIGSQWSGWSFTRPGTVKAISALTDAAGHAEVFAIRSDDQVWVESNTGGWSWTDWTLTQVGRVKGLSAALDGNGRAELYAIGLDNQVWQETAAGQGSWTPWNLTQTGAVKALRAMPVAGGHPQVFVIGMDDQVWAETCNPNGLWNYWNSGQNGRVLQVA